MAVYVCDVCGEKYDESQEAIPFDQLPEDWTCPVCKAPKKSFHKQMEDIPSTDPIINEIQSMASTGSYASAAMDTMAPNIGFDKIFILGAQLAKFPKDANFSPSLKTTIGKNAEKPMILEMPVFVSHMSFGALSAEAKMALAKGSAIVGTATCSGEGGILPEEMKLASKYIFEYVPNKYSMGREAFEGCDAVEIKIGQGTKPGMGGHLPGSKVTEDIARIRQKPMGQDVLSPSKFDDINSPEDMRELVSQLRYATGGKPIGIKIAAGDIEGDLEFISKTGCDFITIDGRGGATGSSPAFLRDNTSVPTVFALSRARKYMDEHSMDQSLIITGGFRTGADVAKAIAMGADAIAMASAPLIALGCKRYRICGSGMCPMGIATQDKALRSRLDVNAGAERVSNYFKAVANQLKTFASITGNDSIHDLTVKDLCTIDDRISSNTNIRHA